MNQSEAANRFIAATEHEKMHDERLWDLRQKRDREMHGIPEWEELRSLASAIKEHTLTHLDRYLNQFEANARANGIYAHWAKDGADHNQTVLGILRGHGAIHHAYHRPEFRRAHYAVLQTGPSATADIEGVLIHGAQGVRSLSVLLLARGAAS